MLGRVEGRLQLMFCCRTRDVTGGLGLGEEREREEKVCGQPTWFSGRHGL